MNTSTIDWQLIVFGGTRHSFTNPDADKRGMAGLAYSPSADRRSWQHMTYFFDELFAGMQPIGSRSRSLDKRQCFLALIRCWVTI